MKIKMNAYLDWCDQETFEYSQGPAVDITFEANDPSEWPTEAKLLDLLHKTFGSQNPQETLGWDAGKEFGSEIKINSLEIDGEDWFADKEGDPNTEFGFWYYNGQKRDSLDFNPGSAF